MTLCAPMDCSMPGFSRSLLKFMSIESVMLPNHLILCHPFLIFAFKLSQHQGPNESALRIRWPVYWSFSFSPPNEHSELIFFRIEWFDFLAAQGTLKSLHQHHNLKASVFQCSVFLRVCHIYTWLLEKPQLWLALANGCFYFLIHCLGF